MNQLTKIFIAEPDCESLVSTMLWLEQYPEFEVYGNAINGAALAEQINEVQPDLVLLGSGGTNAQAALFLKRIRACVSAPAVVLVTKSDTNLDLLAAEFDGQIGPRTTLKDIPELIRKAVNRRRLSAITAANIPMAKAG
jgi:DNA-binding NarL/FixJ family response regulator